MALADGKPLYRWLAPDESMLRLPVPSFNVVNGGAHAQNQLEFQEFMICPLGAPSFAEGLRAGAEVYQALRGLLHSRGQSTGLGDEGGFAPDLGTPEEVLDLLVEAIGAAGYSAGRDGIGIALDPASSEMREKDGSYRYSPGSRLTTDEMIDRYEALTSAYPIWSIEDGLGENDWEGWEKLTARLGERVQLVGDDIFVTNPSIIREAITRKVGNSALIKLNQIGTVSETLEAMAVCREAGYTQFVSHRSGETPDTFIADLVVGTGSGQIKTGAPLGGNEWPSTTASSPSRPKYRAYRTDWGRASRALAAGLWPQGPRTLPLPLAVRDRLAERTMALSSLRSLDYAFLSRSLAPSRGRVASSNQSRLLRTCSGEPSRAMSASTSVTAHPSTNNRSSSLSTAFLATTRSVSARPSSRARLRASKSLCLQLRRQYIRGLPAPCRCTIGRPHQPQPCRFVTVTKQ